MKQREWCRNQKSMNKRRSKWTLKVYPTGNTSTFCQYKNFAIIEGTFCLDHIHIYVSIWSQVGPASWGA